MPVNKSKTVVKKVCEKAQLRKLDGKDILKGLSLFGCFDKATV